MRWKPRKPPFRIFKNEVFKKAGLVTGFIYQTGEYPQLRKPSQEVSLKRITTDETQRKFAYLKSCLKKYRQLTGYGRGIAAVQVGIPERFACIYFDNRFLIIINPRISGKSERKYKYPEMCMSANPVIAPVVRPAWIEFTYYDELGRLRKWNVKDTTKRGKMLNRIFQHEIDHMDGVINIDLASPEELILLSDPAFYESAGFVEV
jgi:peptide deformylase